MRELLFTLASGHTIQEELDFFLAVSVAHVPAQPVAPWSPATQEGSTPASLQSSTGNVRSHGFVTSTSSSQTEERSMVVAFGALRNLEKLNISFCVIGMAFCLKTLTSDILSPQAMSLRPCQFSCPRRSCVKK